MKSVQIHRNGCLFLKAVFVDTRRHSCQLSRPSQEKVMCTHNARLSLLCSLLLLAGVPAVQAQFAVIDVGAIAQMIEQVATMADQLSTARNHLRQAQQEFQAMTGGRGMEQLL